MQHRDDYFLHRLEAFSDIVIGFSLALLTLNLTLPNNASELLASRSLLETYVITFALVCLMWWSHYRLFRYVFVPTFINVVLNFASLMTIGLLIYFMQVWHHQHTVVDDLAAARQYFGALGLNLLVNAILNVRCARMRKPEIPEAVYWRSIWLAHAYLGSFVTLAAAIAASFWLSNANLAIIVTSTSTGVGWWLGILAFRLRHGKHAIMMSA